MTLSLRELALEGERTYAPVSDAQIGDHPSRWRKKYRNRTVRRKWRSGGVIVLQNRYSGYD